MRLKQKRKTNNLVQKLQEVKYEIAKDIGEAYKKGNELICQKIGKGNENNEKIIMRQNYCEANFLENVFGYQNCMENDEFCHLCCDNEFGEFYIDERENCYLKSCKKLNLEEANKEETNIVLKTDICGLD